MSMPTEPKNAPRLAAVCDVLGFSDLVKDNSTEHVVENSIEWLRKALHHAVVANKFPEVAPPTKELDVNPHVSTVLFSDTILLYTRQDTDEAVSELIQVVALLLFQTIVAGATKIRAGISYGDMHIDAENSIYVGQPIIDAHKLEKNQEWAGAALTEPACSRVNSCGRGGKIARWWTTMWNVPLKDGTSVETLAVNWNHGVHDLGWKLRWCPEHDVPPPGAPKDLAEKFWNTKQFHESHCHECRR